MAEQAISADMSEQMRVFKAELHTWCSSQQTAVEQQMQRFEATSQLNETRLAELSREESELRHTDAAQKRAAELASLELSQAQQAKQRLSNELNALPTKLSSVQQQIDEARERLEKHRVELRSGVEANARRLQALTQGALFYKRRLGLEFEVIDGDEVEKQCLRIIFSGLGPQRDQTASFLLAIDGEIYSIQNLEPQVEGVDVLIERLNNTNEFPWFVQVMRRSFQKYFY